MEKKATIIYDVIAERNPDCKIFDLTGNRIDKEVQKGLKKTPKV